MIRTEEFVPSFFIAGAPKSGTTALHSYLRTHPQVFMPALKEPHFFCSDLPGLKAVSGVEEYATLFRGTPPSALNGEASASYLMSKEAVPEILGKNPSARFIIILRNPVEMSHSLHSELVFNLSEDVESFSEAWDLQEVRASGSHLPPSCREPRLLQYRTVCSIGDQLERFVANVPTRQRLILLFDDLKADPGHIYRTVLSFLELEDDGRTGFRKENPSKRLRSRKLSSAHRSLPQRLGWFYSPAKKLGNALGVKPSRILNRLNVVNRERPPLDSLFRAQLEEEFRPQVEKVAALLGRDLSRWRWSEPGDIRGRGF